MVTTTSQHYLMISESGACFVTLMSSTMLILWCHLYLVHRLCINTWTLSIVITSLPFMYLWSEYIMPGTEDRKNFNALQCLR